MPTQLMPTRLLPAPPCLQVLLSIQGMIFITDPYFNEVGGGKQWRGVAPQGMVSVGQTAATDAWPVW